MNLWIVYNHLHKPIAWYPDPELAKAACEQMTDKVAELRHSLISLDAAATQRDSTASVTTRAKLRSALQDPDADPWAAAYYTKELALGQYCDAAGARERLMLELDVAVVPKTDDEAAFPSHDWGDRGAPPLEEYERDLPSGSS